MAGKSTWSVYSIGKAALLAFAVGMPSWRAVTCLHHPSASCRANTGMHVVDGLIVDMQICRTRDVAEALKPSLCYKLQFE